MSSPAGVERACLNCDFNIALSPAVAQASKLRYQSRIRDRRSRREQRARRAAGAVPASGERTLVGRSESVSDIDLAYATVTRGGAVPISAGPQELPAWNPNAGGIRAVYFRDPDSHPLELIQFPPGKGAAHWQNKDRLFLGIDHSAIAVRDTETSLAFYRGRLGLHIAGTSENWGIEQERLSAVPGAHVRITSLRAQAAPGIELLHYLMPTDGRPAPPDTRPKDLWSEVIVMAVKGLDPSGLTLRDPDGHALSIEPD